MNKGLSNGKSKDGHIKSLIKGFERLYKKNPVWIDPSHNPVGKTRFTEPSDIVDFIITAEDTDSAIKTLKVFESYVINTALKVLPENTERYGSSGKTFVYHKNISHNIFRSIKSIPSVMNGSIDIKAKMEEADMINQNIQAPEIAGIVLTIDTEKFICGYERKITDLKVLGDIVAGYNR